MLVLSRKPGEKLLIGDNITVTVLAVHGNHIQLGFEAPKQVNIKRSELIHVEGDELADPELMEKPAEWLMEGQVNAVPC